MTLRPSAMPLWQFYFGIHLPRRKAKEPAEKLALLVSYDYFRISAPIAARPSRAAAMALSHSSTVRVRSAARRMRA